MIYTLVTSLSVLADVPGIESLTHNLTVACNFPVATYWRESTRILISGDQAEDVIRTVLGDLIHSIRKGTEKEMRQWAPGFYVN